MWPFDPVPAGHGRERSCRGRGRLCRRPLLATWLRAGDREDQRRRCSVDRRHRRQAQHGDVRARAADGGRASACQRRARRQLQHRARRHRLRPADVHESERPDGRAQGHRAGRERRRGLRRRPDCGADPDREPRHGRPGGGHVRQSSGYSKGRHDRQGRKPLRVRRRGGARGDSREPGERGPEPGDRRRRADESAGHHERAQRRPVRGGLRRPGHARQPGDGGPAEGGRGREPRRPAGRRVHPGGRPARVGCRGLRKRWGDPGQRRHRRTVGARSGRQAPGSARDRGRPDRGAHDSPTNP